MQPNPFIIIDAYLFTTCNGTDTGRTEFDIRPPILVAKELKSSLKI